jgi:iron complex transport system ATP-binding protein
VLEILDLQDVTVRRGSNEILSHVSWQVLPAQRWIVMGSNGAGKTTLMQICSGFMHPTTGNAKILGYELGRTDVRELRTLVGISSATVVALLPPEETVLDSILTSAYGISGRWRERYDQVDRDRAHSLMADWGLTNFASRRIGNLSEGERKRVQIARALMCDPELLILDEPAAGLDVGGREDLVARLARFADDADSPSLVLVTHHVEEIPPNFTHALLLKSGQVSAQGALTEVISSATMSQAFGIPLDVEYGDQRWHAQGKLPSRGRRARA